MSNSEETEVGTTRIVPKPPIPGSGPSITPKPQTADEPGEATDGGDVPLDPLRPLGASSRAELQTASPPEFKYLAIKNWEKYQGGMRDERRSWVKDYIDKDADPDYSKLTFFQRALLDGIRRLRGRFGKNLPNDPAWISRALCAASTDRPHLMHALSTLIARGFLLLSNQQIDTREERREREEKREQQTQPQNTYKPFHPTSKNEHQNTPPKNPRIIPELGYEKPAPSAFERRLAAFHVEQEARYARGDGPNFEAWGIKKKAASA